MQLGYSHIGHAIFSCFSLPMVRKHCKPLCNKPPPFTHLLSLMPALFHHSSFASMHMEGRFHNSCLCGKLDLYTLNNVGRMRKTATIVFLLIRVIFESVLRTSSFQDLEWYNYIGIAVKLNLQGVSKKCLHLTRTF